MFCKNCGKELPAQARYCPYCGTKSMAEQAEGQFNPGGQADPCGQSNFGAQADPCGQSNPGGQSDSCGQFNYGGQGNFQGGFYGGAQPGVQSPNQPYPDQRDQYGAGWLVLGLFFPLIGLILYLVWETQMPNRARALGKGALIGFCISVGLSVLITVVMVIFVATMAPLPYYAAVAAAGI